MELSCKVCGQKGHKTGQCLDVAPADGTASEASREGAVFSLETRLGREEGVVEIVIPNQFVFEIDHNQKTESPVVLEIETDRHNGTITQEFLDHLEHDVRRMLGLGFKVAPEKGVYNCAIGFEGSFIKPVAFGGKKYEVVLGFQRPLGSSKSTFSSQFPSRHKIDGTVFTSYDELVQEYNMSNSNYSENADRIRELFVTIGTYEFNDVASGFLFEMYHKDGKEVGKEVLKVTEDVSRLLDDEQVKRMLRDYLEKVKIKEDRDAEAAKVLAQKRKESDEKKEKEEENRKLAEENFKKALCKKIGIPHDFGVVFHVTTEEMMPDYGFSYNTPYEEATLSLDIPGLGVEPHKLPIIWKIDCGSELRGSFSEKNYGAFFSALIDLCDLRWEDVKKTILKDARKIIDALESK